MKICFIVEGYPTDKDPIFSFIKRTVTQFVLSGHECTVIAPQSIIRPFAHHCPLRPYKWYDNVGDNKRITVIQPKYITLPGIKPTIMILLLMNIGHVLNAGFEVQYLLGNGLVQSVSQTIDIYVLKW